MSDVVYFVPRVLGSDVTDFVAFLAGPGINFCPQDSTLMPSCDALEHVTSAVKMSLEFSNNSGF